MTVQRHTLKDIWIEEENRVKGINNFSYIDGRWDADELPWNYRDILSKYLKKTDMLLDLDTGNGEFLLTLDHPFELTGISEGYDPNYELCKVELEPLGITVKKLLKSNELPYEDGMFDVVHNRNGSFNPDEVWRVLKPNGYFITQQIGGLNDFNLSKVLIDDYIPAFPDYNLNIGIELIRDKFDVVEKDEGFVDVRFYDVGTIIAFASIARVEFPNFSVDRCFDKLLKLQDQLEELGHISTTQHRFMMVGQKKLI